MRELTGVALSIGTDAADSSDQGRQLLWSKLKFFAAAMRYDSQVDLSDHSSDHLNAKAYLEGLGAAGRPKTFEATAESYLNSRDNVAKYVNSMKMTSIENPSVKRRSQIYGDRIEAGLTFLRGMGTKPISLKTIFNLVRKILFSLAVNAETPIAQVFLTLLMTASIASAR